jgi:hypothetical protein
MNKGFAFESQMLLLSMVDLAGLVLRVRECAELCVLGVSAVNPSLWSTGQKQTNTFLACVSL